MKLERCGACEGFVPRGAQQCPNCMRTALPGWLLEAATVVAGAGLAMTLSACYGAAAYREVAEPQPEPVVEEPVQAEPQCADPTMDADGDGYCDTADCDESDPDVHDGCPAQEGAL